MNNDLIRRHPAPEPRRGGRGMADGVVAVVRRKTTNAAGKGRRSAFSIENQLVFCAPMVYHINVVN